MQLLANNNAGEKKILITVTKLFYLDCKPSIHNGRLCYTVTLLIIIIKQFFLIVQTG